MYSYIGTVFDTSTLWSPWLFLQIPILLISDLIRLNKSFNSEFKTTPTWLNSIKCHWLSSIHVLYREGLTLWGDDTTDTIGIIDVKTGDSRQLMTIVLYVSVHRADSGSGRLYDALQMEKL